MRWVKKNLDLILIVGAFLILDLAALDDITTGNEPNFYLEYAILMISVFVFVGLAVIYRRKIRVK